MKLQLQILVGLVLAISGAIPRTCSDAAEATNIRMQRVVRQFIAEQSDGTRIVALGSWADKGGKYADVILSNGTSDHDMRFIPRPGSTEAEAIEQWKYARNQLRGKIIEEFGTQKADKVLRLTNLYAPDEVMVGVEDAATAAARYDKLQTVPTLIHSGSVDANTAKRYAEGLYGDGAKVWKQIYEVDTGRVIYAQNGKAYSGFTDLLHKTEGQGKFSAKGMGETTTQWIEHVAAELEKGDARALGKQLKRIDRDLHKGRSMARVGPASSYREEIQQLIKELDAPGADVKALSGRINRAMSRGKLEAEVLKRMDDAGSAQRAVLKTILESTELNGKAWNAIKKIAGKVPYGAIVEGLMASAVLYGAYDTAENRSQAEAIAKLVPELASVAPGILVEITDACLEEAKETGYIMMANRQDAMDLIAGIYTAQGREQAFERTGKKYDINSIDQLVRTYRTLPKLEAFVLVRAQQAAARDAGVETGAADMKVAQAIYDKCFPYLLHEWREKRDEYRREYIRLLNQLRMTPLILTYTPNPAELKSKNESLEITLTAQYMGVDMTDARNRMREILKVLTVDGIYINTDVEFSAKGVPGGPPMTFLVWARKPGTYTTNVMITDVCGAAQLGDAGITEQRSVRTASVEVPVTFIGEPTTPEPAPVVVAKGRFTGNYAGVLVRQPWISTNFNRKGWLDIRINGTQVSGFHVGENGQGRISGNFNPETRSLTASVSTTLVGTEVYTLTGSYSEQSRQFTGSYTAVYTHYKGTLKTTESGTWSASGKMTGLPPVPPEDATPKVR